MDPNITGRFLFAPEKQMEGYPHPKKIAILRMTEMSHGNAAGLGIALCAGGERQEGEQHGQQAEDFHGTPGWEESLAQPARMSMPRRSRGISELRPLWVIRSGQRRRWPCSTSHRYS